MQGNEELELTLDRTDEIFKTVKRRSTNVTMPIADSRKLKFDIIQQCDTLTEGEKDELEKRLKILHRTKQKEIAGTIVLLAAAGSLLEPLGPFTYENILDIFYSLMCWLLFGGLAGMVIITIIEKLRIKEILGVLDRKL